MFKLTKFKNKKKGKCLTCEAWNQSSNRFGICENKKTNKFIFYNKEPDSKIAIMTPKYGVCKFYKRKNNVSK